MDLQQAYRLMNTPPPLPKQSWLKENESGSTKHFGSIDTSVRKTIIVNSTGIRRLNQLIERCITVLTTAIFLGMILPYAYAQKG